MGSRGASAGGALPPRGMPIAKRHCSSDYKCGIACHTGTFLHRSPYGAPFSHLFTELKISLIEVHISAIELEISPIHLKISSNQLEISTIRPI